MTYIYTCKKCKKDEEIQQSMADDLPTDKKCSKCGEEMFHNIGKDARSSSIIIPEHMTATEVDKPQIKYDKSPSRRKHYF